MANYQRHFFFSVVLGLAYAAAGIVFWDIFPEHAVLAAVIIVVAGMLPDLETGQGSPSKEFAGLIAAITPLLLFEFYPEFKAGGITRMALVVISSYFVVNFVFGKLLLTFKAKNGMLHSLPSAVVTAEIVYLLFSDVYFLDRLFLASAAFVGFLFHLVLDAMANISIGKDKGSKPKSLKLFGQNRGATLAVYSTAFVLGWFIYIDF